MLNPKYHDRFRSKKKLPQVIECVFVCVLWRACVGVGGCARACVCVCVKCYVISLTNFHLRVQLISVESQTVNNRRRYISSSGLWVTTPYIKLTSKQNVYN